MENPEILQETVQPNSKPNTQSFNEDGEDPAPRKPRSKAQGRKRTKTGCLTCRKRRIKCGEERPTCQNCTKSKRHCEGYNQRVVFKDPLNAYRPSLSTSSHAAISRPSTVQPGVRHGEVYPQPASGQNPLPLAPKPQGAFRPSKAVDMPPLPAATSPGSERRVYTFSDIKGKGPATEDKSPQPRTSPPFDIQTDTVDRSHVPDPPPKHSSRDQATHYDFNALVKQENKDPPITPAQISPLDWSAGPSSGSPPHPQELYHDSNRQFAAALPFYQTYPTTSAWEPITTPASVSQPLPALVQRETAFIAKVGGLPKPSEGPNRDHEMLSQGWQGTQLNIHNYPPLATEWTAPHSSPLEEDPSAIAEDEDDPFDVSDDDIAMEEEEQGSGAWQEDIQDGHLRNNDLGIVVALQVGQDNQDLSLRSFTSFIDRPDMLATYVPSSQSTPLRDPMTARIFCHFVNVTGPCISLFERHPANPSLMFQGVPVPKSQQNIWAYTFPTLALQNPALLHSMLALGSLHIAKLQNGPIAASLKHYAIGLRRVAKSVSIYSRRRQPATLAAAMLLAFYECWSADHQKWSNHILGAKQLVREIDFAGMTRYIKNKKVQERREERLRHQQAQAQGGIYGRDDRARFQPNIDEVDENIVSMLMGKKLFYDQYGQIIDDSIAVDPLSKEYSERDLETYETQRDLFWWYCKQDVYQSILGGGRLFMEYSLWSHCPPRSPLGRLTATYGTFDHLILLMGRLADFAAKDLKRKQLAMKANGGHWRPPPEYMRMQAQAAQASGSQTFPQTPPKQAQMPAFSGMVPGVQEAQLPMGFEPSREDSPRSTQSDEMDLQARTHEAEEEWQEIRNAFGVLEDYFGEDFQALGPEFSEPMETPFGPALKYRTYAIAGIWMNFYMGLIACHRSHPSMPPAAMMAAGIAARQTASFANELGRIAAGIAPDCSLTTQVNPTVGAALIESSTCLFVSGVQYQNAAQREWTVRRLRDIGRLTGWQTAYVIAAGCETSWAKTAELGKGPPYTKTFEEKVVPDLWISSRRIDRVLMGLSVEERRSMIERSDRVHYALGVLSIQEDFENFDLDSEESEPHPM